MKIFNLKCISSEKGLSTLLGIPSYKFKYDINCLMSDNADPRIESTSSVNNYRYSMLVTLDYQTQVHIQTHKANHFSKNTCPIVIGLNPAKIKNQSIDGTNLNIFKYLISQGYSQYIMVNTSPIILNDGKDTRINKCSSETKINIKIVNCLVSIFNNMIILACSKNKINLDFTNNIKYTNKTYCFFDSENMNVVSHMSQQALNKNKTKLEKITII